MKRHLSTLISTAILSSACLASAADVTRIVEPTSEDSNVGFRVMPIYRFQALSGQIAREAVCQGGVTLGPDGRPRCANDGIALNRELDWEQNSHYLDVDVRVGVGRIVEFGLTLPIALSHLTDYRFAKDVSEANSTIDPNSTAGQIDLNDGDDFYSTYHYFEVSEGFDAVKRSGIGDLQLHLNVMALSQARNPNYANLLVGLTYQAPTGKTRRGDNSGVGAGVHRLTARIAASRQIRFVEPYFATDYTATLGNGGLFEKLADTQMYTRPGHQLNLRGGVEFELYSNRDSGLDVRFGLGVIAGLQTPGRDYSPLFEGFSRSKCNGQATLGNTGVPQNGSPYNPSTTQANTECAWVAQQPANAANGDYVDTSTTYSHNGITSVERHLYVGGEARLRMQFQHNIGMQVGVGYRTITNHLITGENTGEDFNGDRTVDLAVNGNERNPYYNPTFDATARRFVIEGYRRLDIDAAIFVQF